MVQHFMESIDSSFGIMVSSTHPWFTYVAGDDQYVVDLSSSETHNFSTGIPRVYFVENSTEVLEVLLFSTHPRFTCTTAGDELLFWNFHGKFPGKLN